MQFKENILLAIDDFLAPIVKASSNKVLFLEFIEEIGWDVDTANHEVIFTNVMNALAAIENTINALKNNGNISDSSFSAIKDLVEAVNNVIKLIKNIKQLTQSLNGSLPVDLSEDIINHLTVVFLETKYPKLFEILKLIGVVRKDSVVYIGDSAANLLKVKGVVNVIDFTKLKNFLSSPKAFLNNEFFSGGIANQTQLNVATDKLFPRLAELLGALNFKTSLIRDADHSDLFDPSENQILRGLMAIETSVPSIDPEQGLTKLGASIGLLHEGENGPGFFITPYGQISFSQVIGEWVILFNSSATIDGIEINKNGIEIFAPSAQSKFNAELLAFKDVVNGPSYIIGSSAGTHLQIGNYIIRGYFNADAQKQDAGIEMELRDAYLKIAGGDGDGFVSKVLPEDGLKIDFNLTVGYSKNNGLYFGGSGGFQTSIPVNKSIGPVLFKTVDIGLGVISGKMKATVGSSFSINIGSFTAELKDVGLKADIDFPSGGGNLGPIDLDMGFKLPKGVGLAFFNDVVKGGGYIEYDEVKGEYGGVVEIKIMDKITAKAVAVLSTKMADGSKGYSLLLIVSAEGFTPVPLGFGFNLIGVGGLLGLNRGYVRDELVKGLYDGGIQDVMFPQIIEKDPKTGENKVNFSRVISNVTRFFPAEKDRFLFGPFGKINWGTGTLITADIGIVFKVPEFAILILGVIKVRVPEETNAYLKLNINFLGEVNVKKKYIAFDAVIYDSRLLTFTLSGTMAFRFLWGDNPQFLLTVGGFHPAYRVPSGLFLPAQQRMAVSIADSDDLKLRLQSYFALTTNSVQFGAALYGYAEAGPCSAEGAVIFDALFMFSPFRMDIALAIYVRIKYDGDTILSANLDMHLTGPDPWRAWGSISFTVFGFIDCSISVDHTFGNGETQKLPPVNVWEKLLPALSKKENWKTTVDFLESQQVTMRKQETSNLLVAPNGKLIFQQGIVPLFTPIEKFGQNPINDYTRFELTDVRAGNSALSTSILRDNFPSGEFFRLSDSAKLDSANSYTNYPNGLEFAGSKLITSPYYNRKEIKYEEIFVDGAQVTRNKFVSGALPASLNNADLQYHLRESTINQNGFSNNKLPIPVSLVSNIQTQSVNIKIVDKATGGSIGSYATATEAGSHLATIVKNDPSLRGKYTISY